MLPADARKKVLTNVEKVLAYTDTVCYNGLASKGKGGTVKTLNVSLPTNAENLKAKSY